MNLVSDSVAKKLHFYLNLTEIGTVFRDTFPQCLSKPLCVYVCTIIIHIVCEWHAEARGGEYNLQLKNRKKWVGYLHPLYLKKRLESLSLKTTI